MEYIGIFFSDCWAFLPATFPAVDLFVASEAFFARDANFSSPSGPDPPLHIRRLYEEERRLFRNFAFSGLKWTKKEQFFFSRSKLRQFVKDKQWVILLLLRGKKNPQRKEGKKGEEMTSTFYAKAYTRERQQL